MISRVTGTATRYNGFELRNPKSTMVGQKPWLTKAGRLRQTYKPFTKREWLWLPPAMRARWMRETFNETRLPGKELVTLITAYVENLDD